MSRCHGLKYKILVYPLKHFFQCSLLIYFLLYSGKGKAERIIDGITVQKVPQWGIEPSFLWGINIWTESQLPYGLSRTV